MSHATPGTPDRVHLDNGGRAPWHPLARQAFEQALGDGWADPRRLHAEGRRAARLLDGAREAIAAVLGARTQEVHFTPSHTASLHTAVASAAAARRRSGTAVVTSAVERSALLQAAAYAAGRAPTTGTAQAASAAPADPAPADQVPVEPIPVDRLGRVDAAAMIAAVQAPGVALAALQHANGEVGTVQPVEAVHDAARAVGVPLLVDAGASVGHVAVPAAWDLLAADPADWGGPAGTGVLAVRQRVRTAPVGPEDEDPWAPGGVSVPLAFAAAVALQAVEADRAAQEARRRQLVERLRAEVARIPDVEVVGDPDDRLPHVATFSFLYVDGEALVTELDRHGFAVGSGSACTSSTLEPSHVLAAMGVLTHGNVRIALDRATTADEVDRFCAVLPGAVARVREMLGVGGL
ncbi:cysteine desulfurase family protein [Promicromonospora sp. NPDC060271]|uniref:cysteine desulfurase family protein n=1 Tax=Promicromonospora sp. NPDC060271 TaxID=3347089 RepID=UPI00365FDD0C